MAATGRACAGEGRAQSAGPRRAAPRVHYRRLSTGSGACLCRRWQRGRSRRTTAQQRHQARGCTRRSRRGGPGHTAACADHGWQAIVLGRIRACAVEASPATSSDGASAANTIEWRASGISQTSDPRPEASRRVDLSGSRVANVPVLYWRLSMDHNIQPLLEVRAHGGGHEESTAPHNHSFFRHSSSRLGWLR
jgi:hypothetical protein